MLQLYLLAQCAVDIFFRSSYAGRYSQREDINCAVVGARPKCRRSVLYCKQIFEVILAVALLILYLSQDTNG